MKYEKHDIICLRCMDTIRVIETDFPVAQMKRVKVVDDYCPECKELIREEA